MLLWIYKNDNYTCLYHNFKFILEHTNCLSYISIKAPHALYIKCAQLLSFNFSLHIHF